jgi:putrescine aminotransferase
MDAPISRRCAASTSASPASVHRSRGPAPAGHARHRGGVRLLRDRRDRQRLFDGLAGLWCVNVGYGRREIADAVHKQMTSVCFYPSFFNTTTEPTILLADKIAALAPKGMGKVFFSNSGSEANETALKLIRAYNKLRGRSARRRSSRGRSATTASAWRRRA